MIDIVETPSYKDMEKNYQIYSLGFLGEDISIKFAIISLVGYITYTLRKKKPDVTCYQILKKIVGETFPEDYIKGISVVCEDFMYGCTKFPTFGLKNTEMPNKIKDLLQNFLPF